MPEPAKIAKAELRKMKDKDNEAEPSRRVVVQFNPETLKVTYSNQVTTPTTPDAARPAPSPAPRSAGPAGAQGNPASNQFVGKGATKLSVQLWFDVTARLPQGTETDDVLSLTREVVSFITPEPEDRSKPEEKLHPPLVRFLWGTFLFDGIVESLDESLELFSPEGRPLRACLTLGLTQSGIADVYKPAGQGGAGPGSPAAGTRPQTPVPAGATMPGLADARGLGDWQSIAAANGIENPRLLAAGTLIDMNLSASASIGVGASATLSGSAAVGASASVSASASASASAGAGLSATGSFNL